MMVFAYILISYGLSAAAPVANPGLSLEDYAAYKDWMSGCEDPRLADDSEDVRYAKIAKTIGLSGEALKKIVERVAPLADGIDKAMQDKIKVHVGTTVLKTRLKEAHVDARQGHVVAGLKWQCGDMRDVKVEAAYAAWAVAQGGFLVKTLVVWCTNEVGTKLFSAKIGRPNFLKIQKSRIERFGRTRYIRLFEEVREGPHK
jgi:hypothetical protein